MPSVCLKKKSRLIGDKIFLNVQRFLFHPIEYSPYFNMSLDAIWALNCEKNTYFSWKQGISNQRAFIPRRSLHLPIPKHSHYPNP